MAVPQSSALQWYNIVTLRDQNLMLWPLYIFTNMQRLLSYSGIGQKSHIFAVLAYLAAGTSVVQNLQCRPDLNHYYSPNLISHMQTYKEVLKTWAMLWATCSTWPCSRQVGWTRPSPEVLSSLNYSAVLSWEDGWSQSRKTMVSFWNHSSRFFRLLLGKLKQKLSWGERPEVWNGRQKRKGDGSRHWRWQRRGRYFSIIFWPCATPFMVMLGLRFYSWGQPGKKH